MKVNICVVLYTPHDDFTPIQLDMPAIPCAYDHIKVPAKLIPPIWIDCLEEELSDELERELWIVDRNAVLNPQPGDTVSFQVRDDVGVLWEQNPDTGEWEATVYVNPECWASKLVDK